jgi:aryl-alcohol dehydrogenase-like predicted oxidoreductase
VDALDLYWAHSEDRSTDLEETVAAFGALVRDGAVRRLGVSNHPTWRVEQARSIAARLGVEPYTALQLTTSYVEPRPGAQVPGKDHRFGFVTDETADYLQTHPEIDLWVYSPLVQGSFDRADRPFPEAYDHPGTTSRLAALNILARDRRVPASQVVLAWLVAKGWKPIVGVSSVEQLESALASDRISLTPEELAVLR